MRLLCLGVAIFLSQHHLMSVEHLEIEDFKVPDGASVEVLTKFIETSKEKSSRVRGIVLMGQMGNMAQPALELLIKQLEDDDPEIRQAAADAINYIGINSSFEEKIKKHMIDERNFPSISISLARACTKAKICIPELKFILPVIIKVYSAKNKIDAAELLAWFDSQKAAQVIEAILGDASVGKKDLLSAILCAENFTENTSAIMDSLKRLQQHSDSLVRFSADRALRRISVAAPPNVKNEK